VSGETLVNGQPTDDIGFAAISIVLPLIVAVLGVLAIRAKPEYDSADDDTTETEGYDASEMDAEKNLTVFLISRILGPVLLVGGFVVSMYMLESEVMPIAIEANETGAAPEFGFEAIKVLVPLAVALVGFRLIKLKTLPNWSSKD
jgi:hypothetical protein